MNNKLKIRVVTATEAKNRFGDLIKSAYLRQEHLIVKRDGIPVVAIVPIDDYQRLFNGQQYNGLPDMVSEHDMTDKEGFTKMGLSEFLQKVHERIGEVDEDEAERDILEAVREVRAIRRAANAGD